MMPLLGLILAHWKLAALGLLVAALGVQTIRLQSLEAEYDQFVLEVQAAGREAKAKADAADAHHQLVNEELENDIQKERETRARQRKVDADRFAGLYAQYFGLLNTSAGGGAVPKASGGAPEPVQHERACLDGERLVSGLRASLGAFHSELEPLLRRGEDGLDARQHFGQWARLVGACPKAP